MATTRDNVIASAAIAGGATLLSALLLAENQDLASLVGSAVGLLPVFFAAYFFYPSVTRLAKKPDLSFILILTVYYGFGIFPLTTYRGYIDELMWMSVLACAIASFLLGRSISGAVSYKKDKDVTVQLRSSFASLIILISALCAGWIIANHGLVLFNPEARFGISAKISYLVELAIPAVIAKFCYELSVHGRFRWKMATLPAMTFLILLSLGYRNQPILLVLGLLLPTLIAIPAGSRLLQYRTPFALLVPVVMFLFGISYLVRTNNSTGRTLDWEAMIREYSVVLPEFTLPYVPLHLASREGMGVAEASIERLDSLTDYVQRSWFFFSDFLTMLPGYSMTSGRVLGVVVNGREDSSLTPSILGGLMIGYGMWGVIVFFLITGAIFSYLVRRHAASHDPRTLAALSVFFIYMLELMNRGIFKPMYIIAMTLTFFLFKQKRKAKSSNEVCN
ncbi:hypothetical protein [Stenotrophomonas sp. SORGH_AS_0321]|uniref:hypothetical protein n=1 Tax=Stenotrophomonas sp. SORGH_AS_0321 TaxID=3041787 RepID=UPI00285C5E44|nr:hypothetical protein [Stenotrophomonas sp. SORGH_AS_0321]MDR6094765.1 hypothetical protein [Stenotrophomonas sp. SORGH_AS_0321]